MKQKGLTKKAVITAAMAGFAVGNANLAQGEHSDSHQGSSPEEINYEQRHEQDKSHKAHRPHSKDRASESGSMHKSSGKHEHTVTPKSGGHNGCPNGCPAHTSDSSKSK